MCPFGFMNDLSDLARLRAFARRCRAPLVRARGVRCTEMMHAI